ncbi:MAG: GNAT family N-acyltransferase [Corticimicrobacter sp.]|uniref:L-ornithine N(alpha)-acyltransferase n=1 Tax=Corticimicrobacter populi TaxID=2175229 RepID=A0A2V1K5E9_9BURK|nr:GNAT family N-acyltransferase [Corticimicrobacter populi]PWF24110.1 GNAT family N-acetyltransferase [Corticimicrobacter populi]QDQ88044.1 GNAT family N-acetyltransferase [Alcaligenaceae bacterium SJ-26]
MLELVHMDAGKQMSTHLAVSPAAGLTVGLARSPGEVEQAQRLRFRVYSEELGVRFPDGHRGIDVDYFDQWCEHLLVREVDTGRVVGTYRILTPEKAREAGRYYSESEFDLAGLSSIRHELVEFGRSCTDPEYRNGGVIMQLWSGLTKFLYLRGYRYAFGCASVSLRDDGVTAAEVWRTVQPHVDRCLPLTVQPLHRYPFEKLDSNLPARIPALIKGYLKVGAKVCGEPAWDPDFNAADFPVMLCLDEMTARYRRHFGLPDVN